MRIALTHDLPAGGGYRYLIETTVRSACEHEYVLLTTGDDDEVDPRLRAAVKAVEVVPNTRAPGKGRIQPLAALWHNQRATADMIDHGDFDLAVLHPSQTTQAPLALRAIRTTPTVYVAQEVRRRTYEHGYQPWVEVGHPVQRGARRIARAPVEQLLRRADRRAVAAATTLVANSSFSVETIERAYGRTALLCHPGADLDRFPLSSAPRSGVLSVGALDPTKGHDLVVDALALLPPDTRPDLTIVYERHDPRFTELLSTRAGAAGVRLTLERGLSDADLAARYGSVAATVCAARLEPFGLTVLESFASGTPVVAVREGGFCETVTPGRNGELVDRDPDALAAGIARVLSSSSRMDPGTIRASLLPYWTWDRTVDDLHRIYARTAGAGR
jgi:glycosyltransferase involved in cell wall biosynthesis